MPIADYVSNPDGWNFDGDPALPIVHAGEIRYLGWDITDKWAIDSDGRAWCQKGAHGGRLYETTVIAMIVMAEDDARARRDIAQAAGELDETEVMGDGD